MVFKKLLLSVCAVATLSVAAADDALARDKLRVGTEPTFAPFEFMDTQTREFVGYDIDLIRAVADKAGYDIEVVNMGFDALIPALGMGVVDVVAAGVTITEERSKRVDFTAPYYTAGLSMLVRKEDAAKYPDFKSLKNQAIAVQIGTTGAEVAKGIPGTKIKAFNTSAEAFMDLKMNGSDVVITDRPVIGYFLVTNARAAKGLKRQPMQFDSEYFGFAVKKGNTELRDKVNAAMKSMKDDGTYDKIYAKWFGES